MLCYTRLYYLEIDTVFSFLPATVFSVLNKYLLILNCQRHPSTVLLKVYVKEKGEELLKLLCKVLNIQIIPQTLGKRLGDLSKHIYSFLPYRIA